MSAAKGVDNSRGRGRGRSTRIQYIVGRVSATDSVCVHETMYSFAIVLSMVVRGWKRRSDTKIGLLLTDSPKKKNVSGHWKVDVWI